MTPRPSHTRCHGDRERKQRRICHHEHTRRFSHIPERTPEDDDAVDHGTQETKREIVTVEVHRKAPMNKNLSFLLDTNLSAPSTAHNVYFENVCQPFGQPGHDISCGG